jgi:hypothetical protein
LLREHVDKYLICPAVFPSNGSFWRRIGNLPGFSQFNGKTGVGLGPGGASPGYAASFDMMMVPEAVDLMVGDEGLEPPTPSV